MDPLLLIAAVPALIFFSIFWTELKGAGWQPTPRQAIESALKLARVRPGDVFYDLGAGDGRVLVAAAKAGARAVGIEIDPLRCLACRLRIAINRLGEQAHATLGDVYSVPLSGASVVFIYLRDWSTERLKDKLMAELQPGTRIITYYWPLEGWQPAAHDEKNSIYVYQIRER
ncbi:MAG: SAM-dependent methyltransferase [Candidatus Aenigmatarchaeota archaeon]